MKKLFIVSCVSASLLIGCGGSGDPFVDGVMDRVGKKMKNVADESVIESCIESASTDLTDENKDTILAMLSPDSEDRPFFENAEVAKEAVTKMKSFMKEMNSCVVKNK